MSEPLDSITSNDELEDGTEETQFHLVHIDTKLLMSPTVLRAIGGIGLGLAWLIWPNRSDRILARLLGLALVWLAMTSLRALATARPGGWLSLVGSLSTLGVGVVLILDPDRSSLFVGRLIGFLLIGYAILAAYKIVGTPGMDRGLLTAYGLMAAVGLLLTLLTEEVIETVVALGAIGAIVVSTLVLFVSLDKRTGGTATYTDTAELVSNWLSDRPKSVDARRALYDKILYEGPTTYTRVIRFFALMGFASVIAAMGVITDSTAVVIGAMLVAPLMTPLMGMAISLVMGWPNRLTRSAAVATGGILLAIGIGALLGLVVPAVIDTTTNAQIVARTSPTVLDLIIAIAAGAAGAYGLSRPDVSDSLPGVAIAISLVPPLAVVGIAYSQGDWAAGNGALLLFATNMIAILLVGGVTFVLTGVTPVTRVAENQYRVRTAVGATCTAGVVVFGALLLNGAEIAANTLQRSTVESTVEDWISDGSQHRLARAGLDGDTVVAVVVGPSDGLPDVAALAESLSEELGRAISVDVSLVVEQRFTATGDDGS